MIYRIAIGGGALLFGAMVLRLTRRDRLHTATAAWWLGAALLLLVLGVAPERFHPETAVFGLELPPSAPLFLTLAFLALRGLLVDMDRARRELCLRRLVRRHAYLELRLREMEQALAARGTPLPERDDMAEDPEGTGGDASPSGC